MNKEQIFEFMLNLPRTQGSRPIYALRMKYPEEHNVILSGVGIKLTAKVLFDYLRPDYPKNCIACGKETKFERFYRGYPRFCGTKCSHGHEETKARRITGTRSRYGVDNVSQAAEVKQAKIDTCQKNFGVDFPMQSQKVQTTSISNELARSGGKYTSHRQRPEQIEALRNRISSGNFGFRSKKYQEWLSSQGVINISQLESVNNKKIKTYIRNYGASHPMQNPDVFKDRMKRLHKIVPFEYRGRLYELQGYEPQALKYLVENVSLEQNSIDVPDFNVAYELNGKSRRYYPDLIVGNTCIEVKSTYTAGLNKLGHTSEELRAKAYGVLSSGREYLLMIMDKTGSLVSWSYDGVVLNKSPLVGNNFEGRP